MLKGKNIAIGVTGGIAAYKVPLLVRDFIAKGAHVRVAMTESAREFVTPLTLSTVSDNAVTVGTFPSQSSAAIKNSTWHIDLARWAHVFVIAPATANVLAKLAHGIADDAVTTLALAMRCPIVVSPAMDVDMWHHTATQENVSKLQEMGYLVIPPEEGALASGLTGRGRLPELATILHAVEKTVDATQFDLKGKKILVTAGPTHEAIDAVRYIGNRSSGKMGFALARAAAQRGASVTLITGQVHLQTPRHVQRMDVENADQMFRAVMKSRHRMDAIVMTAAVADFTPAFPVKRKLKKDDIPETGYSIPLKKTEDILQHLGRHKKSGSVLVGFALETHQGIVNAKKKIKEKKLDFIVLNNALQSGSGFEIDTNIVTIITKSGRVERLKKMTKFDVAQEILNRVSKLL